MILEKLITEKTWEIFDVNFTDIKWFPKTGMETLVAKRKSEIKIYQLKTPATSRKSPRRLKFPSLALRMTIFSQDDRVKS